MTESPRPRGFYFEEFDVGYSTESPSRTITETDVVLFAGLSGDYNPLHTDAEFARETPFGERIAHGLLVLSIVTGMAQQMGFIDGTVLAFRGVEWKFSRPVKFDDTVHARFEVVEKKAMRRLGGGVVIFKITVLNQRDEIVQKGTWTALIKSAP